MNHKGPAMLLMDRNPVSGSIFDLFAQLYELDCLVTILPFRVETVQQHSQRPTTLRF